MNKRKTNPAQMWEEYVEEMEAENNRLKAQCCAPSDQVHSSVITEYDLPF